jgi:hypothetical protein
VPGTGRWPAAMPGCRRRDDCTPRSSRSRLQGATQANRLGKQALHTRICSGLME